MRASASSTRIARGKAITAFAYITDQQDLPSIQADAHSRELPIESIFEDPKSWCVFWRQRKQGSRLAGILRTGDRVVMDGETPFAGAADFVETLKDFRQLRVVLDLAQIENLGGNTIPIATNSATASGQGITCQALLFDDLFHACHLSLGSCHLLLSSDGKILP